MYSYAASKVCFHLVKNVKNILALSQNFCLHLCVQYIQGGIKRGEGPSY